MDDGREHKSGKLFGSIFPPKYDFQGMLLDQAKKTMEGVDALVEWLRKDDLSIPPDELNQIKQQADQLRYRMEDQLIEAFSTPFDRQDIYSISRQMDHVLSFSLSTAVEMRAFVVKVDEAIIGMAVALQEGTRMVAEVVRIMEKDPKAADDQVLSMRVPERQIESIYVTNLAAVLASDDPLWAMKRREIYHHLRDAGRNLSVTIDILHRIIVGLA